MGFTYQCILQQVLKLFDTNHVRIPFTLEPVLTLALWEKTRYIITDSFMFLYPLRHVGHATETRHFSADFISLVIHDKKYGSSFFTLHLTVSLLKSHLLVLMHENSTGLLIFFFQLLIIFYHFSQNMLDSVPWDMSNDDERAQWHKG